MIDDAYFERFSTPKYRARSRLKRALIRNFIEELHALFVAANPVERVLEVGVGEGFISGYLSERFPDKSFTGVDLDAGDLRRCRSLFPAVETIEADAQTLAGVLGPFDLVICAEVLEHLPHPQRALDAIARLRPKHCIFTVPHEPWFMLSNLARGQNLRRLGNDPEHINHFGPNGFRRLLEASFRVDEVRRSYPWLLAACRPR